MSETSSLSPSRRPSATTVLRLSRSSSWSWSVWRRDHWYVPQCLLEDSQPIHLPQSLHGDSRLVHLPQSFHRGSRPVHLPHLPHTRTERLFLFSYRQSWQHKIIHVLIARTAHTCFEGSDGHFSSIITVAFILKYTYTVSYILWLKLKKYNEFQITKTLKQGTWK